MGTSIIELEQLSCDAASNDASYLSYIEKKKTKNE